MSAPNPHQLALLTTASQKVRKEDYGQYLRLRALLRSDRTEDRHIFRQLFTRYYGLNTGGATDEFQERYFQLLFGLVLRDNPDPYTPILKELYAFPMRNSKPGLECSFVSKLVGIHDESRPLYDSHVSDFFGLMPPGTSYNLDFRIAGFIANLEHLGTIYASWVQDPHFSALVAGLLERNPDLRTCHLTRICDLLVWTVGNQRLYGHKHESGN